MPRDARPVIRRLAAVYKAAAYATFNIVLLVVFLNIVVGAAFVVRDFTNSSRSIAVDRRVSEYRARFTDLDAYTRISPDTVNAFLDEQDEMNSIGFVYAPWVQFRHPTFEGRLLNTSANGFRATAPPQHTDGNPLHVFVFGGSTTFGVGVPDVHTIPSYLQRVLESNFPTRAVTVRNFGQSFYFSSQELLLFLQLLKDGHRPDIAVFVDGGNDTSQLAHRHDLPNFTPRVSRLWDSARQSQPTAGSRLDGVSWIPMVRLATGLRSYIIGAPLGTSVEPSGYPPIKDDRQLSAEERQKVVEYVVERYLTNVRVIRAIGSEFGVRCLFVWQPHPGYKYDASLHRSFPFDGPVPGYFTGVYEAMKEHEGDDYLYLGDMLEATTSKVFVDDVHYNETTNEAIARRIAERIQAPGMTSTRLVPSSAPVVPSLPQGGAMHPITRH